MNKLFCSVLFFALGLFSCSSSHFIKKKNDDILKMKTTLKGSNEISSIYELSIKNNSNRNLAIIIHENIKNISSDTLLLNAYNKFKNEKVYYSLEYMDFKNKEVRYSIFSEKPNGYVIRSNSNFNFIIEIENNKNPKFLDTNYCFLSDNITKNKLECTTDYIWYEELEFHELALPFQ